jgi:hypothetical protein
MASASFESSQGRSDASRAEGRRAASMLLAIKSTGYLVSTLSVVLLGVVSWKSASEDRWLLVCLIAGMAASVGGMLLRWLSYDIQQRRKWRGKE